MFRYFILRTEQQLFCYLYGIALALVLMLLFYPVSRAGGFYLVALSVALFWAGLALYTRHTDRMRKPEVSPLVSIHDGIQVVAMLLLVPPDHKSLTPPHGVVVQPRRRGKTSFPRPRRFSKTVKEIL